MNKNRIAKTALVIAGLLIAACGQMPKSNRTTADVGANNPEIAAQDLVCKFPPSVPASDTEMIINVHLDNPIEHVAKINYAGQISSTGVVEVYLTKKNEIPQLALKARAVFGKEPIAYSSELRGVMEIEGAKENSWIHMSPNMKKSYFGLGGYIYAGGYKGAAYLAKFGSSWFQSESMTCVSK